MPRPRKPARLELRKQKGGASVWVIRDGPTYRRTGCTREQLEEAEKQLSDYNAEKYRPSDSNDPRAVPVADALNFYVTHHIPTLANPKNEAYFVSALVPFWSEKTISSLNKSSSKAYTTERLAQGVKTGTARRELKALQSAVNMYCADREIPFVCRLEMPPAGESRLRWLSRSEAARFIHAARRRGNHHVARMILIGIYTGTRSTAIRSLRWVNSIDSGYVDLKNGILYRKGAAERTTTKKRPSIPIPDRLRPHLERWQRLDGNCTHVIHRDGQPLKSVKKAWVKTREAAELDPEVIPHVLRHTAASWGIQNVTTTQELQGLANYLGMSLKMLLDVYGHLNPTHHQAASNAIGRRPGA
ncbi:site-specific integrase [uncultured Roseibium sp.]|uniref:site-specific integrase n=1 Tax=uncultured Roseibium sp. TaxID=1936171 RepID=UPI00261B3E52|nr:site-specific integrase [uncultured Roseibium sp.]